MESDDENQYPVIEKVVPRRKLGNSDGISDGSESDIDERELEQLLGQTKRPAMKMYADEMEEQEQARRLVNPFQINGIFHKATYNKVRMVHCIYRGVIGYNFQRIIVFLSLKIDFFKELLYFFL